MKSMVLALATSFALMSIACGNTPEDSNTGGGSAGDMPAPVEVDAKSCNINGNNDPTVCLRMQTLGTYPGLLLFTVIELFKGAAVPTPKPVMDYALIARLQSGGDDDQIDTTVVDSYQTVKISDFACKGLVMFQAGFDPNGKPFAQSPAPLFSGAIGDAFLCEDTPSH